MLTSLSRRVSGVVIVAVLITGMTVLSAGVVAADPAQDDRFLQLLEQNEIPAMQNVPSLIGRAHRICRELRGGMPAEGLVDEMTEKAFAVNPTARLYPPDRLRRTMTRFIAAAVQAYCPDQRGAIATLAGEIDRGWNQSTHRAGGAVTLASVRRWAPEVTMAGTAAGQKPTGIGAARPPRGEIVPPGPPQIPGPPPPTAESPLPPQQPPPPPQEPVELPPQQSVPPPQQIEPPPQQLEPPPPPEQLEPPQMPASPQQVAPPALDPRPGGAGGNAGGAGGAGDGSGGGGDGGEAPTAGEPPAEPLMPPGFVKLAP